MLSIKFARVHGFFASLYQAQNHANALFEVLTEIEKKSCDRIDRIAIFLPHSTIILVLVYTAIFYITLLVGSMLAIQSMLQRDNKN